MNSLALLSLAASLASGLSTPANYSGSWSLDLEKSTGLPSYYSRVKSHTLVVTQGDGTLDVAVAVDVGGPAPDRVDLHYPLTGEQVTTETSIRGPDGMRKVPTRLSAKAGDDGSIHVTITRTISMGDAPRDYTTTEDWSLGADGRTLNVHRVDETPRGSVDARMVFVRT